MASGIHNTVSILLNTDTASFGPPTSFTVGKVPDSVAVGDFNGDGHLDLAVANSGDNAVAVLLNGCGPTSMATPTPTVPPSTCVGDCNGDGLR